MKMTLESTTRIVDVNGVKCRVWEGTSERGTPIHAFIAQVAIQDGAVDPDIERDLKESKPPAVAWPARLYFDT